MKYAHYLHKFESNSEFDAAYNGNDYDEPWVSATNTGNDEYRVNYNKTEEEKLLGTPLTFEITGDGNIMWQERNTLYTCTIEYKKNDGEWTSITSSTGSSAPTISVVSGDTVQFRGDNATYGTGTGVWNTFSGTTCQFSLNGNIMSLINSTDFANLDTLQSAYTFYDLFAGCTGLTDASELLLPATTLSERCYHYLFYGCTSLTTAPVLPATTLAPYCYQSLFYKCTNLNYIKCLATDISADSCTYYCTFKVSTSGTFVAASNLVNWPSGSDGIPENWTRENMVESD